MIQVVRSILDNQSMLKNFYPNYIKHCEQSLLKIWQYVCLSNYYVIVYFKFYFVQLANIKLSWLVLQI